LTDANSDSTQGENEQNDAGDKAPARLAHVAIASWLSSFFGLVLL